MILKHPKSIQFEISTHCNANCIFCPHSDIKRPKGIMSDEMFYKIIKEGKAMGVKLFIPFLNGEPFANPKIFDWLDYMQTENVSTLLYTNAGLLTKDKIDRLVKYRNINRINCSINAASKETYDKVTRGPSYDKVVENVRYLIEKAPFRIKVEMALVKENAHEAREFSRMWRRHSHVGTFVNWAGYRHNQTETIGQKVYCNSLNNLYILWDGRVCLCCMDFDGHVILGDLNTQSVRKVWENSEYIRKRHTMLDFDMDLCRDCNLNCVNRSAINP